MAVFQKLCAFVSGVCSVNNLLYVIGGDDGSCNLASVEFYNPNTDKWTLLQTCMSTGRSYAGQKIVYYHSTVVLVCLVCSIQHSTLFLTHFIHILFVSQFLTLYLTICLGQ